MFTLYLYILDICKWLLVFTAMHAESTPVPQETLDLHAGHFKNMQTPGNKLEVLCNVR